MDLNHGCVGIPYSTPMDGQTADQMMYMNSGVGVSGSGIGLGMVSGLVGLGVDGHTQHPHGMIVNDSGMYQQQLMMQMQDTHSLHTQGYAQQGSMDTSQTSMSGGSNGYDNQDMHGMMTTGTYDMQGLGSGGGYGAYGGMGGAGGVVPGSIVQGPQQSGSGDPSGSSSMWSPSTGGAQ